MGECHLAFLKEGMNLGLIWQPLIGQEIEREGLVEKMTFQIAEVVLSWQILG